MIKGKRKLDTSKKSRSQRLAELGREVFSEKTSHELLRENIVVESPCPITADEPGYKDFASLLDGENVNKKGTTTPSTSAVSPKVTTPRKVLGDILNAERRADNSLTSPPSKKIVTGGYVKTEIPPKSRRSFPWSKSFENDENLSLKGESPAFSCISGLALLKDYDSEDSVSCQEFPGLDSKLDSSSLCGFIPEDGALKRSDGTSTFLTDSNNNSQPLAGSKETSKDRKTFTQAVDRALPQNNLVLSSKGTVENGHEAVQTKDALIESGSKYLSSSDNSSLFCNNLLSAGCSTVNPSQFLDNSIKSGLNDIQTQEREGPAASPLDDKGETNDIVSNAIFNALECLNDTDKDIYDQHVPVSSEEVLGGEAECTPSTVTFAQTDSNEHSTHLFNNADLTAGDSFIIPLDNETPEIRASEGEADSQHVVIAPDDTVEPEVEVFEEELAELERPHTPPINDDESHPKPRFRNPARWKRNQVKELKDAGQAHVSLRGKVREAKTMGDGCSDTCKRKCHHYFTYENRLYIFNQFYNIKDHTKQWYYIGNFVRSTDIKRRTVFTSNESDPRRNFSNSYFVPGANGAEIQVCQKFFLGTLAVSEKWVRTALSKKHVNGGNICTDRRGKMKKTSAETTAIRNDIINHIKKFKTVESHYTRKNSKSRYLPECLNQRKMHAQYVIEKKAEGDTEKIASLRQYRDIFKSEFKLKFFRPKKDQCSRCLSFKNKTVQERTPEVTSKYEKHLSDKKVSQDLKTQDIEFVKNAPDKSVCVATCDLEKVFLCPKGENSEFYYKSKLSLFNFTVFVSGDQQGFCFVWDQTIGRRGSAEISSCLWMFIKMKVAEGVKEFHLYSDNCTAQNKNQFLFSMYLMAAIKFNIKIVHRYLEVGHTHMEVDSVHAAIQNSIKNTEIFKPSEWYAAIKLAKKSLPRYEVKEITQEDIFDFSHLSTHLTWDKLGTSLFKEVVIDSADPGVIHFKTEYEQDSTTANVIKRKRGHPVNWKTIQLKKMYSGRIPLRPNELKDLKALCTSGAIPTRYHEYYLETLPGFADVSRRPPPTPLLPEFDDGEDSFSEHSEQEPEENDE